MFNFLYVNFGWSIQSAVYDCMLQNAVPDLPTVLYKFMAMPDSRRRQTHAVLFSIMSFATLVQSESFELDLSFCLQLCGYQYVGVFWSKEGMDTMYNVDIFQTLCCGVRSCLVHNHFSIRHFLPLKLRFRVCLLPLVSPVFNSKSRFKDEHLFIYLSLEWISGLIITTGYFAFAAPLQAGNNVGGGGWAKAKHQSAGGG